MISAFPVSATLASTGDVALHKPAVQNSVHGSYVAGNAVLGGRGTNVATGPCTHTADNWGSPPWWAVNLEQEYYVTLVVIVNRDAYGT